ncbi:MAG: S-adenosylmethionine synthetase N-terminal domain-containing protein, partial [Azospirillaceae bacterium]
MTNSYLFTSESVSEGHPDKVCDRISDAVVDAFLATEDPLVRVACETLVTTNKVVLAGEVRGPQELVDTDGKINKERMVELARQSVKAIGYDQDGFSWRTADVDVYLHGQSADIAMGVDASGNKDEGAGDQGIMFGFACDETPALMPAPIQYSHQILQRMAADRHSGAQPKLGPDAKSQVTLRYENGKPVGCTAVVVSTQHAGDIDTGAVREIVLPYVESVLPEGWLPP